jgi:hypothetical protein
MVGVRLVPPPPTTEKQKKPKNTKNGIIPQKVEKK